ncbi:MULTISPECIES: uracil-xanthine permease family protein [Halorussus]|uniref:uracil-xanthine permease family protein n=1 Tax=Halorussus TaxID=1070314 RepID=UPI0020A1DA1B|nr:solute carrier family 23 protein [Halorussus vallis]USZ78356.1 purine/pyrimidine permease [Halorussus vallis]
MTDDNTDDFEEVEETISPEGPASGVERSDFVEYGIDDQPPLGESILLGFQHYLTMIGATVAIPLALAAALGMFEAAPQQVGRLIGTFFVVSGITTLAQTTIGNRYPIVQGGTFSMLAPALAIIGVLSTQSGVGWQFMLRELMGAVIVAGIVEVLIGYFGGMGALKRYVSPIVIAPTIALIGLALFSAPQIANPNLSAPGTGQNWWLVGLTLVLIVGFSQYLDTYHRTFRLYPVLLGISTAWIVAAVLSVAGVYTQGSVSYVDLSSVASASLIQPIYPFQWGLPRFTPAFVIGMVAGMLASAIESFGDYHAVARMAGRGAPSKKRIDHGIGMEGVGNVLAGVMGTGNGSTSYTENVGAIGITGVASRYVVQIGAIVMLVAGYIGYVGQLFATIPDPIIGGLYIAMFGQIAAVGLSQLQFVDLNSNRNVFIVGFALFAGLAIPGYMGNVQNGAAGFQQGMAQVPVLGSLLGTEVVSTTLFVIGGTGMAVGGIIAFFLDNTIDGTPEERGITELEAMSEDESDFDAFFDRFGSSDASASKSRSD